MFKGGGVFNSMSRTFSRPFIAAATKAGVRFIAGSLERSASIVAISFELAAVARSWEGEVVFWDR